MARILITTQNYTVGGLETNILTYCKIMKNIGHKLYLATSTKSDISAIQELLEDYVLIEDWVPVSGKNVLLVAEKIKRFIIENQIDFAHLHPYEGLFPCGLAVSSCGVPYVVTIHSPLNFSFIYGFIYRIFLSTFLFPNAVSVYCVSKETKESVENITGYYGAKIIPNPVDIDLFVPSDEIEKSDIVLISRLDNDKKHGILEAIRCFDLINTKHNFELKLNIVGSGDVKEELISFVQQIYGLNNNIEFVGHSNNITEYLKTALFAFGMGRVVIEAGAMNIPTVLCGYDGLKGFVNVNNIEFFSNYNFSGRNSLNVSFDEIEEKFTELKNNNIEIYKLREWIIKNVSMNAVGKLYSEDKDKYQSNAVPNWVSTFYKLCKKHPEIDLLGVSAISKWIENFDFNISPEFHPVLLISTEINRLMEEKNQLIQQIGMLNQHLHDVGVYKAENEKNLVDQINHLKEQNHQLETQTTKYLIQIHKLSNELLEIQQKYLAPLESLHKSNTLYSNYLEFVNERQELITQNQSFSKEIFQLRAGIEELRNENIKLEAIKNALSTKIYELSQTKYVKILNLLKRFQNQFIRGNKEDKKAFSQWLIKKVKKQSTVGGQIYNPFFELWRIMEGNAETLNPPLNIEVNDRNREISFESEYNTRNQYYQNLLNMPFSEESEQIALVLKKNKYKGIVVYPEAVTWQPIQRPQQLLREFASNGYLCFFCNSKETGFKLEEIEPNLYLVSGEEYLLPVLRSQFVIVICSWLIQMAWAELLPHKYLWYDVLDQLEFFQLYDQKMKNKHDDILQEADFVSYSATKLSSYVRKRKNAVYLPNAAKIEDFTHSTVENIPIDLDQILKTGNPIIGYYGALEEWFDFDLIYQLAKRNPDWEFVLIGKLGVKGNQYACKNIHFLGPKPYESLYSYSQHFQVGLIPFIVNDLTNCVSPVKFFEYQAAGIPVVSSPIQEMQLYESEFVHIAKSIDEYENAINTLLGFKRIDIFKATTEFSRQHQWRNRFAAIEKIIQNNLKGWSVYSNININNSIAVMASSFLGFNGQNFYSGGAERYLLDLHEVCQDMGRTLTIFQYGDYSWVRRFKDIDVVSLSRGGHNTSVFSIDCIKKFNQLFYEQVTQRSILNIYSSYFEAWPNSVKPSVGISHGVAWDNPASRYESGSQFWEMNRRFIEGAKCCNQLVSVDTNTANWLQTIDYQIGHNVKVIPNYVDLEEFTPRHNYCEKRDKVIILYPRRLYEARGLYIVLEIIDDILTDYPHVEFHFVGKGFDEDTAHVVKKQEKWPDRVKWYWLDPTEMPGAYIEADIALIPTLYSEGTSLSCLEAMASGNAVIATRIGGLTDLILNGYNGLLIDPDAASLKSAIISLLIDKDKLCLLKQRAVEVASGFSKKDWKQKWEAIISAHVSESLMKPKRGRLFEIYLQNAVFGPGLNKLITQLLLDENLLYIYTKNSAIHPNESFGRLQWMDWTAERLTRADVVIADNRVSRELNLQVDFELSEDMMYDEHLCLEWIHKIKRC